MKDGLGLATKNLIGNAKASLFFTAKRIFLSWTKKCEDLTDDEK